jgi:hypothetical protein
MLYWKSGTKRESMTVREVNNSENLRRRRFGKKGTKSAG